MQAPDDTTRLEGLEIGLDDARLAETAFPGWRSLCLDTFMYTSRENYPIPWLAREIVQNFVDANTDAPGTLNGVSMEEVETGDTSTFTFSGNWPFNSYSDLVSFGSGKVDAQEQLAGGNGIGIKQAILRFMRDFGARRFMILGQGWEVEYKMAGKDDINSRLTAAGNQHQASHGSFMVAVRPSENRDVCKYIIETDNPEVQSGLREFENLGVCDRNEHLQGMHFRNEHGGIKWLPIHEVEEKITPYDGSAPRIKKTMKAEKGRLFVNGQIFRCQKFNGDPDDKKNYWRGLAGVSLQLNHVKYSMSIDRPPMENWMIRNHVENFARTMSRDELIANLTASEYLWTGLKYKRHASDIAFCFSVIEAIVQVLSWSGFTQEDYEGIFGGKKYLHQDQDMNETQIEDLQRQGYTICPDFFGSLHMPKASAKLSSVQVAAGKKPDVHSAADASFEASVKAGLDVPYEELNTKASPQTIAMYIRERLGGIIKSITVQPERKSLRLVLKPKIGKLNLIRQTVPETHDTVGQLIHEIRGLAHVGLTAGYLRDIFMAQGQYVTTFSPHGDRLLIRNNESPSDEAYLEIVLTDKDFEGFYRGLTEEHSHGEKRTTRSIRTSAWLDRLERFTRPLTHPIAVSSYIGLAVFAVMIAAVQNPSSMLREIVHQYGGTDTGGGSGVRLYDDSPNNTILHDAWEPGVIIEATTNQRAQLELLKRYLYLTAGVEFKGKFYLFNGKATMVARNTNGNIGMHEHVLKAGFEEAVSVLGHEVVHDVATGHNIKFVLFTEALAAKREDTLGRIARTPQDQHSHDDREITAAEAKWDRLKKQ